MTRRNWFVTLLAPFVAKLSNVGRWKPRGFVVGSNIVLAGPRTGFRLSPVQPKDYSPREFLISLKDPDDTCTFWKRDGAKVLRSIPEGFVAFDQDGRQLHVGDPFTSVRLDPVVAEVEVRMTKDIHVDNPRDCYKLNAPDGSF